AQALAAGKNDTAYVQIILLSSFPKPYPLYHFTTQLAAFKEIIC
ncbi:unnamed protein product, partial [marine sediment metagenome]